MKLSLKVNGTAHTLDVPANTLLVDVIREHLALTGTHVGCDTSQCGACTVHLDGRAVKSCSVLAFQANDAEVTTIEGIGTTAELHPMQAAFREHHALQCGFCTPGMIMAAIDLVARQPDLDRRGVRDGLEGNLCRCTGYHNIVDAVLAAAPQLAREVDHG
jgi:carbon-monoxide dehydrogenase small subunit